MGHFLSMVRERGAHAVGIDLDEDALKNLTSLGISSSRCVDRALRADIVCAFQLIEHLADPGSFVRDVSAVLVPDGRLLLAMPNGGEAERVGPTWIGYRVDLEHLNYFKVSCLARLLANNGVFVEQYWEFAQPSIVRESEQGAMTACRPRLEERLRRAWRQRLTGHELSATGRFVLAVLGRRAAPIT
jgi:SAM-dependent methyltransferase